MHRSDDNRWTSSFRTRPAGGSGSYTPELESPPPLPDPAAHTRRALHTFFITLVALLAVNAALNVALNPSGEMREGGLLIRSVLGSESYQKVRALDEFMARRAGAPMGVVLGSSRVMELSPGDSSAALPYYNCGVSGAKAEDILAFARFIFAHPDAHIAEALIGVDPFALSIPGDSVQYGARLRGVYPLERVMRDRLGFGQRSTWWAAALLGRDWTTSLREVGDPPAPQWFERSGMYPESNYVKRVGRTTASRERYLANHVAMVMAHIPSSPEADPRRVWDIGEAVRLFRAHGARVTLFLPPTNPRLLASLGGNSVFRAQLERDRSTLRELADSTGSVFVDLTDPTAAGLTPGDFWDGYHYTSSAAALVIHSLEGAR
jgi:hypothetical protein